MHKLQWRPLGSGEAMDIPFAIDDLRVVFSLPEGLEFGHIELDGLPVTGYFTPDDPDFIWQLRPYLIAGSG